MADSVTFTEVTTAVQNIVLTITGIIGSLLAVFGYNQWRSQLKGTDKYSVGKKAIMAVIAYRDAFFSLRNPFVMNWEFGYNEEEERRRWGDLELGIKGEERAYNARLKVIQEKRRELEIALKECEVLMGIGYADMMKPLIKSYAEVVVAIQMTFEDKRRSLYSQADNPKYKELRDKHFQLMYDQGDSDPTTKTLARNIQEIEDKIRNDFFK